MHLKQRQISYRSDQNSKGYGKFIPLLCALALLMSGCLPSEHEENGEHGEHGGHGGTPKLEVSRPLRQDTFITKEYVGQIHAIRRIEVKAMARGFLQRIFVDEGQPVSQGQPMFKIVPNLYLAEVDKAYAEVDSAIIEYNNTRSLADKSIVSPNELALAKARLDRANAELKLAETHLGFTSINAPFAGIVDRLEVRNGSFMEEGESLTTLSDTSKMWVYFNVHESEYLEHASGKSNKTPLNVQLKMANGEIFDQKGVVETVVADFDNKTGNIEFRATFPNPDNVLRHGQTGNILMSIPYNDAIVIPQKATFEILDKVYVYVVNHEDEVEQRPIKIAAELPHLYVVEKGLGENDRILLEGLRKVHNGQKIVANFREPGQVVAGLDLYAE